jgi:fructosamine-3-kinase
MKHYRELWTMEESTHAAVADWAGCAIETSEPLDGGEIGTVHRVGLADGRTVVAKTGPTDLTVEARMLAHLAEEGGLTVPEVLHATTDLLVLPYLEGRAQVTPAVERDLAERLASLHATTAEGFGFPFDTLTGVYRQPNPWTEDWATFFGTSRLGRSVGRAREDCVLPVALVERFSMLEADLDGLLDHDPQPALIHGDIWRENLLTDGETVVAFLDPACYYADREVELAYAEWCDVAGDAFFERYREVAGVDDGYAERREVYRLYPLLTHLRYFGEAYLDPIRETLDGLGY